MDREIPVRAFDCRTDVDKQPQPLVNSKRVQLAILRDPRTLDVLHHDVWHAVFGRAAIEQARNIWMLQVRENLTLTFETSKDEVGIHPRTDQLDRNARLVMLVVAFGEIDRAHAPTAQFANQAIGSDASLRASGCAFFEQCNDRALHLLFEKTRLDFGMAREQRRHLALQLAIARALLLEPLRAFVAGKIERPLEEIAGSPPTLRSHFLSAPDFALCVISRWSHASAVRCSRPTVATEMPSACAVSSTLSPPKKRSSTTL